MDDEDNFTEDETNLAIKIFFTLYVASILLMFMAIGFIVYAGMNKWTWYLVIPIWAIIWVGLRTLKVYLRNIVSKLSDDILEDSPTSLEPSDFQTSPPEKEISKIKLGIIVSFAMIMVAGFWYSIGLLIAKF